MAAIAALLLPLPHALADREAQKPHMQFSGSVDVPEAGLQIKIMSSAYELARHPPAVHTYSYTKDGQLFRAQRYEPIELWRHQQLAGKWVDRHNNHLVLARINQPLPKGFEKRHVAREEFEQALAEFAAQGHAWTMESLAKWAADFVGAAGAKGAPVLPRPFQLEQLFRFSFDGERPSKIGYAFLPKSAHPAYRHVEGQWFFAYFDLNADIDLRKAVDTIHLKFFPGIAPAPPPADAPVKPHPTPSRGSSQRQGGGRDEIKLTYPSQQNVASRNEVIAAISGLPDWWCTETAHFMFVSNTQGRHRHIVRQLTVDMEHLRAGYEQLVPARKPIDVVNVVKVFATPEAYVAYVGAEHQWSAGLWLAAQRELVLRPTKLTGVKSQTDPLLRAAFGQGFLQYLYYAFDAVRPAAWFGEGHAAFFENALVRDGRLRVDEDQARGVALAQQVSRRRVDAATLEALLRTPYPEFDGDSREVQDAKRLLAWALVHYLRKAAGQEQPAPYAGLLDTYADALWETRDGDKATAKAFAGVDMTAFTAAFVAFWQSVERRGAARRHPLFAAPAAR
ncbi:MAG: hypothetical protein JXR37_02815 [Kiritimatiellae bacterium]|nr:hypothetical protein [Kiritimatiellia bacterium]